MKYLVFKLINNEISFAIVSPKRLYLLTNLEYALLKDSANQAILKEVKQINKEQILKLITTRKEKEITLYDLLEHEILKLKFESISKRRQFISSFPKFRRNIDKSKARIHPINALLVMLFTYSFIWAGTRPTSADINPDGIRWRLAYWNVQFLEWLNNFIGQKLLLSIGLVLFLTLLYWIFRPEIWALLERKLSYINTTIKGRTENNI